MRFSLLRPFKLSLKEGCPRSSLDWNELNNYRIFTHYAMTTIIVITHTLRFPSVHRTLDWHHSSRVFGPVIVLDGNGPGTEASEPQGLLQPMPRALGP